MTKKRTHRDRDVFVRLKKLAVHCAAACALMLLPHAVFAQQEKPNAAASPSPQPGAAPAIREIGNGVFELGKIRIDKNERTVTFPVFINMNEGIAEYLLVRTGGKTHESVLVTEIEPRDLHVAMLLLGAADNSKRQQKNAPAPGAIDGAYLKNAPELKGDKVLLSVTWKLGDTENRANAEDFVLNKKENKPMSRGAWTYNGSMLIRGAFLAQEERSIAALVIDPAALINNPRPGDRDDSIWEIDSKKTPPVGTPLEMAIKLEKADERR